MNPLADAMSVGSTEVSARCQYCAWSGSSLGSADTPNVDDRMVFEPERRSCCGYHVTGRSHSGWNPVTWSKVLLTSCDVYPEQAQINVVTPAARSDSRLVRSWVSELDAAAAVTT